MGKVAETVVSAVVELEEAVVVEAAEEAAPPINKKGAADVDAMNDSGLYPSRASARAAPQRRGEHAGVHLGTHRVQG
jgi:hypothetical protein